MLLQSFMTWALNKSKIYTAKRPEKDQDENGRGPKTPSADPLGPWDALKFKNRPNNAHRCIREDIRDYMPGHFFDHLHFAV